MMFWSPVPLLKPYWKWEDYKAGMFKKTDKQFVDSSASKAVSVLSDPETCLSAMRRVVSEWPVASMQNLHDASINRRPWLGRACCCITECVREDAVRLAWWMLTEEQRNKANQIADAVISEWELINA